MHHFMTLHQDVFAWNDSERGHFREDFFPPVEIPTIAHEPWVLQNIPIPPGIYKEVFKLIQNKIEAGVFEPSNSSYRSRWFTVTKKDGKSLCIVQSLEPLNAVTIAHSGIPPFSEQLAEQFAGCACGGMLDLFVGYDEHALAESSHDLITFQTPFGAQHLTKLPMGCVIQYLSSMMMLLKFFALRSLKLLFLTLMMSLLRAQPHGIFFLMVSVKVSPKILEFAVSFGSIFRILIASFSE